jgi:hypothetical protein
MTAEFSSELHPHLNTPSGIKNSHELADMPAAAVRVFDGELFNVYQWHQEMFDGSMKVFERLSQRDGVDVIAITSQNTFLVLHEEQPARPPFLCARWENRHST